MLLMATMVKADQYGDFGYTTNGGSATITNYTGSGGTVIIPDTINGFPVTTIGISAFASGSVTNVTIPNSVTSLQPWAFDHCYGLRAITLGNAVTTIADYAFQSCLALASVTIPESVNTIANSAFRGCGSLTNITLGSNLASIGPFAFYNCASLSQINIPASVTSIGSYAFIYCDSLTSINVDPLNSVYAAVDGVLFNQDQTTLIACPGGKVGSYEMPGTVTNIQIQAFLSCGGLTGITLGNRLANIGLNAFMGCSGLTNIIIPASVTVLGSSAFSGTGLKWVLFEGSAPSADTTVFSGTTATVYYLPGPTGLGWRGPKGEVYTYFGGRPAALWNPIIKTKDSSFGIRTNRFGFNIAGTNNIPIKVEACANLASPAWITLQTCTLTNGSLYFSDPDWTNYPLRLYRIRWP
jgi:hypothetical protein